MIPLEISDGPERLKITKVRRLERALAKLRGEFHNSGSLNPVAGITWKEGRDALAAAAPPLPPAAAPAGDDGRQGGRTIQGVVQRDPRASPGELSGERST